MLRKTTVRLVTNANVTDSIQEMITGRAVALSVPKTEVMLKIHLSHTGHGLRVRENPACRIVACKTDDGCQRSEHNVHYYLAVFCVKLLSAVLSFQSCEYLADSSLSDFHTRVSEHCSTVRLDKGGYLAGNLVDGALSKSHAR